MSSLFSDDFLDSLAVVGFIIGVLNYEENLSQSDKDEYENLVDYLYKPYEMMGGNGSAARVIDEVKSYLYVQK